MLEEQREWGLPSGACGGSRRHKMPRRERHFGSQPLEIQACTSFGSVFTEPHPICVPKRTPGLPLQVPCLPVSGQLSENLARAQAQKGKDRAPQHKHRGRTAWSQRGWGLPAQTARVMVPAVGRLPRLPQTLGEPGSREQSLAIWVRGGEEREHGEQTCPGMNKQLALPNCLGQPGPGSGRPGLGSEAS